MRDVAAWLLYGWYRLDIMLCDGRIVSSRMTPSQKETPCDKIEVFPSSLF